MRKDYFEMNLKKLIQKCRPAPYRLEFKEALFRQMTREIRLNTNYAAEPRANILRELFHSLQLRPMLRVAAVPAVIALIGISYLMDFRTNLPVDDGKVIVFQSADNRDYIMGNGQNAVNYITHASSSLEISPVRPGARSGNLRQAFPQLSATNNS